MQPVALNLDNSVFDSYFAIQPGEQSKCGFTVNVIYQLLIKYKWENIKIQLKNRIGEGIIQALKFLRDIQQSNKHQRNKARRGR